MPEPAPMPSSLVLFAISCGVLLAFVLLLWAINAAKVQLQRPKSHTHQPRPTPAGATIQASPPSSTPQVAAPPRLPLRVWLDRVNNHPDRVPHIAAKGPS